MSDYDRDWMDNADLESDFWDFWCDVTDYAQKLGVTPSYVEEEFLLDGELVTIDPPNDPPKDKQFRFKPRPGIM